MILSHRLGKIFAKGTSGKGLYSKKIARLKKWAKDLNRYTDKEDIQIANKHIKEAKHNMPLGNFKLK